MTHKLHAFVPPCSLSLNFENAPNPARKHFEKTNSLDTAATVATYMGSLPENTRLL